jgi:hypothetical protein
MNQQLMFDTNYVSFLQPPTQVLGGQSNLKKRKLQNDDITYVELPRDALLTMSSRELEESIARLTSVRGLTSAEQREVKRQRRLIKNREYAQTSRVKKKQFVEELRHENKLLKERILRLEQENHFLRFGGSVPQTAHVKNEQTPNPQYNPNFGYKQQLPFEHSQHIQLSEKPHMGGQVHKVSDTPSPSLSNSDSLSDEGIFDYDSNEDIDLLFADNQPAYPPRPSGTTFVGSLCLMVILFSFCIFLTPNFLSGGPVLPVPSPVFSAEPFRTSRNLLTFTSDFPQRKELQLKDLGRLNSTHDPGRLRLTLEEVMIDEQASLLEQATLVEKASLVSVVHRMAPDICLDFSLRPQSSLLS